MGTIIFSVVLLSFLVGSIVSQPFNLIYDGKETYSILAFYNGEWQAFATTEGNNWKWTKASLTLPYPEGDISGATLVYFDNSFHIFYNSVEAKEFSVSSDGLTYTTQKQNIALNTVVFKVNDLLGYASSGPPSNSIITSVDGVTWTVLPINEKHIPGFETAGGFLIAYKPENDSFAYNYATQDGKTWTTIPSSDFVANVSRVLFYSGPKEGSLVAVVGHHSKIFVNVNNSLSNWEKVSTLPCMGNNLVYGLNYYTMFCEQTLGNFTIIYSPDLVNWQTSTFTGWHIDEDAFMGMAGDKLFIMSDYEIPNQLAFTTDLIDWTVIAGPPGGNEIQYQN